VPPDVWGLLAALIAVVLVGLYTGTGIGLVAGKDRHDQGPTLGQSLPPAQTTAERVRPARAAGKTRQAAHRSQPERNAPRPTRIKIGAIDVSAPVMRLGLAKDGAMQTPTRYGDTGWYGPGPEPGERGASVIAGHVDSKTGPAVFYKLKKLRRGNRIAITRTDGSTIHFKVEGLERWPKARFPTKRVFAKTPTATLRLITCSGAFDHATGHYVDNTIVYAVRV
jgi:sortase (surface protein transpeptidase)